MTTASEAISAQLEHDKIVSEIICRTLLVDIAALQPSHHLVEDLGADSLNLLEIVLDINEAFAIELPPEGVAKVRRVEDLFRLVLQTFNVSGV